MPNALDLIETVLHRAHEQGLDPAPLARRAGLRAETLSRARRRGSISLRSLQALSSAASLELRLVPCAGKETAAIRDAGSRPAACHSPLAESRWGLAWSNPGVPTEVLLRNALANGNFELLLEAALAHGLDAVQQQWRIVGPNLSARARQEVERKLLNIQKGFDEADA
jgi:hypothetical protein